MIELKVTGENVEQFRANLDEFLAAMLKLVAATEPVSGTTPTQTCGSEISSTASRGTSGPTVQMTTASAQRMAEAPAAAPAPSVHSDRADDLFMEQKTADPAPKVAGTKASSTEKKTKGPKLDDLKTRLSEVIVAATDRWDQKRANAYARKLLDDLLVKKLSDLAPDSYGDFLMVSNAYLAGDAPE